MPPLQSQPTRPPKEYPELPVADLAPRRKSSPLVKVGIVLAIVVIAGVVTLLATHHSAKKPAEQSSSQAASNTTASEPASVTHISDKTKRYDSTNLFLGFDYPADWVVKDDGTSPLSVTSPSLKLKTTDGTADARIVVTIQNAQGTISAFAANTSVAPIESQKLNYKTPTPGQRAQTYLTAVNYAGSSATIDAFYITGDNGYTAGQYVPGSDVAKDNPLITIAFYGCANSDCTNYVKPTAITTASWADSALSKPLTTMLKSLQID